MVVRNMATQVKPETVLLVDDEDSIRYSIARKLMKVGYNCEQACNAEQALAKLRQNPVDMAILDIIMPGKSGLELLPEIRENYPDIAVVMATAVVDPKVIIQCMKEGAQDYLTKPFSLDEILQCVDRVLRKRKLEMVLKEYQQQLQGQVAEQTEKTRAIYLGAMESLIFALEAKDKYTAGHSRRVTDISLLIGRLLGLNEQEMENLRWGALLHDVGKIAIDPAIQNKPAQLTREEYTQIMSHAQIGYGIVKYFVNKDIQDIVQHHHDFFDGSRQGQSITGKAIPYAARIVALADAYDAMASERPYRKAMSYVQAMEEIKKFSGKQFDPELVKIFLGIPEASLEKICRECNNIAQ
jgi:putative two-component system response regulator